MKIYPDSLVNTLQENSFLSKESGFPLLIKPIPGNDLPGRLDAAEIAYATAFLSNTEKPKTIEDFRRQNGKVNYNLNTVEIITDCITLSHHGRQVRLWLYMPRKPFDQTDRPVFFYVHGGSFFAGSPFQLENPCRLLAEKANAVVCNIEYSLAPEHPYPQGYEDILFAISYLTEHASEYGINPNKRCIGGDSAGASLAASVAATGTPFALMALFYPSLSFEDASLPFEWKESDYEIAEEERALILPKLSLGRTDGKGANELMAMIRSLYLPQGGNLKGPSISPLYGDFSNVGHTIIFTAEYDGLRICGEYLAKCLYEKNLPVTAIRYRGVFHAFLEKLGILPQAEDAILEVAKKIHAISL